MPDTKMAPSRCALVLLCAFAAIGYAEASEQSRGKALLERMCSRCHAVGRAGPSPHVDAPPFRTFGEKIYDEDLGQRLQDGLFSIHSDMPTFHFSREDAEAAVNYLRSIQVQKNPGQQNRRKTTSLNLADF
jgi:mono/diheme cytochrome c family protein